jgi:hypothetical protein
MEGKRLDGYPIFGGHWKLPRLLKTQGVVGLIISSDGVNELIYDRIFRVCRDQSVEIVRAVTRFEPCEPVLSAGVPVQPAAVPVRHAGSTQLGFRFIPVPEPPDTAPSVRPL